MRLAFVFLISIALVVASSAPNASGCRLGCPRIYLPVCGHWDELDGTEKYHTFANDCVYESYQCLHPNKYYYATSDAENENACDALGHVESPLDD